MHAHITEFTKLSQNQNPSSASVLHSNLYLYQMFTALITLRIQGSNGTGRVEVLYNGQWGTICDDNWDINDARVACRQLGYTDAVKALEGGNVPDGTGRIWLDEVGCSGSEQGLADCYHSGWGTHDCGHHEDAGVECLTERFVEDILNIKGKWKVPRGGCKELNTTDITVRCEYSLGVNNLGGFTPPQKPSIKNFNEYFINTNLTNVELVELDGCQGDSTISLFENDVTNLTEECRGDDPPSLESELLSSRCYKSLGCTIRV
ncbi:deleted in malignant brain tumors 1 -like [Paramuricea clavata]|uniref:Deleted in malignant brain tumors 1 -like, partial n=1 Tax=Paramuricea clavata TaxID=317549 RepID=A0A7D9K6B1_PARCT|nr:deleted in malignant brain tumors 1 -like [Paramuricea clavata]